MKIRLFAAIFAAIVIAFPCVGHAEELHADYHGDHHDHDHSAEIAEGGVAGLPLTLTPDIEVALAQGGEPVVADLLGVVCDFCATALNKTFNKNDAVAAVYVDLDTKTLNLVVSKGKTLSDEEIAKLVEKSGYKLSALRRGPDAL